MEEKEKLQHLRHSAAHLLAAAVMEIWPDTKRTIGPAIEDGFYFDFEFPQDVTLSEKDFPRIENKMREIVKSWTGFERHELSKEDAFKEYPNNPYKAELIEEFSKEGQTLTFYKSGNYWDLCKGGHIDNPKEELRNFKLMKVAGAYWRGNEKNKMLTRIYGTAFFTKEDLENYLIQQAEAKERDHKKLGPQLDLFIFAETSPGMPYWLPKGLIVFNTLLEFPRKVHKDYGYQEVMTPILSKKELYETSGHWFHYRDDMFISPMSYLREDSKDPYEGAEVFGIKPMNCPNAMTIFSSKMRSYRELPMRLSETTALHRFELSGTLNGLFRAREFHQDDAHIFVTGLQIRSEFLDIMKMIDIFYTTFNLSYKLRFGTRPENFMGEANDWDAAEHALKAVLDDSDKEYFVAPGEGAFYGPKVDILMKDSLGREWQTGTIQLDFQQPKNFKLKFVNHEGNEIQPVVIHRAIYGSFERFLGILIENYTGAFPLWLAPVQVALLPIADRHIEAAEKAAQILKDAGIRVEVDTSSERLQAKIRTHTLQKVPLLGIIGDKEAESASIAVRERSGQDLGQVQIDKFLANLQEKIDKKVS